MLQLKYILNSLINLPLFPILIYQAKQIRKNIPSLPEAKNPNGTFGEGNQNIRILGIGESTIAGVGVKEHSQGFTGHLARILSEQNDWKIDWQVMAKSGYTAKKVQVKLLPKLKGNDKDLIIIGLGGNDTFKMTSPNQWQKDLQVLIDGVKNKYPQTPIVFMNMPPVRDFPAFTKLAKFVLGNHIDLLHEATKTVVARNDQVWYSEDRLILSEWLNRFEGKTYTPKDFFSDGVHPAELTYKTWANEAATFIQSKNIVT